MGGGTWSGDSYKASAANYSTKSADDIFAKKASDDMLPKGVKLRESRDSDEHPESLGVIISLDVTGSMGTIPEQLIKGKLGAVMETLISHGIKDPQIMFCAHGDHECDHTPFQISQFESSDGKINSWLEKIHIESGGGGNAGESYALPWYFASRYTSLDCFEKRGQKGFLFTIGDEPVLVNYPAGPTSISDGRKGLRGLVDIFGGQHDDMSVKEMLSEAQRMYHVFHIHIDHGSDVNPQWNNLLGQNLIVIDDPNIVAETIAVAVAAVLGHEISKVAATFDDATATKLTKALVNVQSGVATTGTRSATL